MDVELLIQHGKKVYIPVVEEGITWSTERVGTPGQLTFNVVKDSIISFTEGDAVRVKVNGKKVFYGFVFVKKRNKDGIITVTAYDQLRYLKNKDTYVYTNKTAGELIQMLASDFNMQTGTIEDTGFKIASRVEDNTALFDMIQNALFDMIQNALDLPLHLHQTLMTRNQYLHLTLNHPRMMKDKTLFHHPILTIIKMKMKQRRLLILL